MKNFIFCWLTCFSLVALAQKNSGIPFKAPPASVLKGEVSGDTYPGTGTGTGEYLASQGSHLCVFDYQTIKLGASGTHVPYDTIVEIPQGREIKDIKYKYGFYNTQYLILLDNGQVIQVLKNSQGNYVSSTWNFMTQNQFTNYYEIIGDDVYVLTSAGIYVTRDTGSTWQLNTTGISVGTTYYNMALDTAQNVYAITTSGLYKQALTSNLWQAVPAAGTSMQRVFTDRQNRIWIASNGQVKYSSDGGATFLNGPTGLPSQSAVLNLKEDFSGNLFVLTGSYYPEGGNRLYRSLGGTGNFTRIDQNVAPLYSLYGTSTFYTDLATDSAVVLFTKAGLHVSLDFGNTWKYLQLGYSKNAYALVPLNNDSLLISADPGVFSGNSNAWKRRFPTQGFQGGVLLYKDAAGNVYAQAEPAGTNSGGDPKNNIYKSTNHGVSWVLDTNGIKAADVGMSKFCVDQSGGQHAAGEVYVPGFGNKLMVWKKNPGQNWVADVAGLPTIYNTAFLNSLTIDNQGNLYISFANNGSQTTYSRPISGSTWLLEPNVGNTPIFDVAGNSNTTFFGGVTITKKTGSTYANVPLPAGINGNDIVYSSIAVDANNVLWAYFELFKLPANKSYGSGIFYSDDYQTWKSPDGNADTLRFRKLVASGDSIFALPLNYEGIYVFDTTSNSAIGVPEVDQKNLELVVVPNPFANQLNFSFVDKKSQKIKIELCNANGTVVAQQKATSVVGKNQMGIQTNTLPAGLYIYTFTAGKEIISGKVILQR